MPSNDTDEIICSNCGRPNLPEANKCWYCQSPLNKDAASQAETGEPEAEGDQFIEEIAQPTKKPVPVQDPVEDIPDWLKRIREKEQKVREAEEASDQWQQQGFFGTSAPAKSAPMPRKRTHTHTEPAEPEKTIEKTEERTQPPLESARVVKPSEKKAAVPAEDKPNKQAGDPEGDPGDSPNELADELPDGFIRFDSKSQ